MQILKTWLTVLIILLQTATIYAQNSGTITGIVTDGRTGKPVIGATVLICETTKGAATDGDLKLSHIVFAAMTQLASDANKNLGENLGAFSVAYFNKSDLGNRSFDAIADLKLRQPNSMQRGFDPRPSADSPLLIGPKRYISRVIPYTFDAQTRTGERPCGKWRVPSRPDEHNRRQPYRRQKQKRPRLS